ncbi:hypothetical protein LSH36_109g02014 [Paralvinella palmiformis]|uniref:Uncharacterized protein n=1 Tax=Paralvinella palmiformis TaxID=53620 RepID=A0AAD9JZX7_9ANNE|nr:hypothetical protein LSH36_109g02014 [Paralvinella palmiformis]
MKDEQFLANPIKGSVMVMLGQIFTIQPHVYKKFVLDYPMELENRLIAVSKSTFVRKISLSEIKTGSEVVSVLQKLVHMDMATKKSCKLPQKVLDLLMDVKGTDVQDVFQNIVPQQPTEKAFTCTQMVKHSDMDFLMHTNQGTYMRFAFDCAAEAASQNGFQVIKEDICRYQVVKANTLHMSETFAGDKLIVKVWDDDVDPYRLHCAIFKNKTNVFYVSMNLTDDVI